MPSLPLVLEADIYFVFCPELLSGIETHFGTDNRQQLRDFSVCCGRRQVGSSSEEHVHRRL
jgi:hypothetical protein